MIFSKFPAVILFVFCIRVLSTAQDQPQLVLGIIVDQMRYDYLYRYWNDYGDKGFKRLLKEGYVAHDGQYQYAPTFTGPGHASVYTGSSPNVHGIIGNSWYQRSEKKQVNCVGDPNANTVGAESREGHFSPHRLLSTTLGDQMKLASNNRSKVYSISIKNRGAVLPGGHMPDGAFWYDNSNGKFITSDYYMQTLPTWLTAFNDRKLVDEYMNGSWETLLPLAEYEESLPDGKTHEKPFPNTELAQFPYNLRKIGSTKRFGIGHTPYTLLPSTPFGNSILVDLAKELINKEAMGTDSIVDLLAISFSSTDYVGHQFGSHSVEVQDIYIRLDRLLGEFLDHLDQSIGLNNTLVFLTADHAAADEPGYAPPAGYFQEAEFEDSLRRHLTNSEGLDVIESLVNQQIYFQKNIPLNQTQLEARVRSFALSFPGIHNVISLSDFSSCISDQDICDKIREGIMPVRSGDLYIQLHPGWISQSYEKGGTTHGSPYNYDTHVPIIFFGWKIHLANDYHRIWVKDITPTIAAMLKISRPSGCTGTPIVDLLERR